MSILDGQQMFEELSERTNRYAAVYMIAKEARRRAEKCNNLISHAEALSWVLTGTKPETLVRAEMRGQSMSDNSNIQDFIDSYISLVDDREVAEAARDSINQTIREANLVYMYSKIQDEPRRSRVRIITRMLWDQISKQFLS